MRIMKRVKQLPENLINQIAAGEVIERPASVVKELVENSIDAGATKLEIEISNECRNIRVADNGSGIHKEDLKLAFSRHATSKIHSQEDLWRISSLGFRGEALASIISISKVFCTTRTADSFTGYKVSCENSDIQITETGCSVGTIMEVNDIFYNVPARIKFLKKAYTEFAYIAEMVEAIALARPDVAIKLINKGNIVLKTSGSGNLRETIAEIFSKELVNDLFEINKLDEPFNYKAFGYCSSPEFTKGNRKSYYLFINGRTVKCPILIKSVDNAYKDMIPSGRFPFMVINLSIPPNEIDVNAHPTKKEIRYSHTNQIYGFVYASIKQALEDGARTLSNIEYMQNVYSSKEVTSTETNNENQIEQHSFSLDFEKFKQKITPDEDKVNAAIDFYKPESIVREEKEIFITPQINNSIDNETVKIIGQFHNTYILIEEKDGIVIVDQHIAHERTIYERLKQSRQISSQLIISTQSTVLNLSDIAKLKDNKEILNNFGIEFEVTESNEVILKKIPQILSNEPHSEILTSILNALDNSILDIENELLISMSCKAAVKANEKLAIFQMERLIKDWKNSPNNQTCPHGRIISRKISLKEIASYFGRFEK